MGWNHQLEMIEQKASTVFPWDLFAAWNPSGDPDAKSRGKAQGKGMETRFSVGDMEALAILR